MRKKIRSTEDILEASLLHWFPIPGTKFLKTTILFHSFSGFSPRAAGSKVGTMAVCQSRRRVSITWWPRSREGREELGEQHTLLNHTLCPTPSNQVPLVNTRLLEDRLGQTCNNCLKKLEWLLIVRFYFLNWVMTVHIFMPVIFYSIVQEKRKLIYPLTHERNKI